MRLRGTAAAAEVADEMSSDRNKTRVTTQLRPSKFAKCQPSDDWSSRCS
jgi:hypothetical protein